MPKVFVVNKEGQDYSSAKSFGELVPLVEEEFPKLSTSLMYSRFASLMKEAEKEDYLLTTSLTVMCVVAAGILAARFKRLNLLLYKGGGKYAERTIVFE